MECYNFGAPKAVHDIIMKYSVMAGYVCTVCGKPATYETSGYIASFCDACRKDFARHERGEFIEFKPWFKVERRMPNGEEFERIVSFENEWNRYLKSLEVSNE
jgi:hypothetical protein